MNKLDEKVVTAVNVLLYILSKLNKKSNLHKIFKILYFADQNHLLKYGRSISSDRYIAMSHGPVPSMAYDIFKSLKGEGSFCSCNNQFGSYFALDGEYKVSAKVSPNMDYISKSEKECIDKAVKENKSLSFSALSAKSHDLAWRNADRNGEISIINMAKAAGSHKEMLNYIKDHIENETAVFE